MVEEISVDDVPSRGRHGDRSWSDACCAAQSMVWPGWIWLTCTGIGLPSLVSSTGA